ncbi:putative ammonium transporter 1 [Elsinoe ampelina]|uniref:Ammonium transporter n=1 Tax=Elsinoe ampelina TaxID=302913 RepID=A0A6A6GKP1_9PEZI|nr:putative ammonium transporter 1 [Elsinoe ampelina]
MADNKPAFNPGDIAFSLTSTALVLLMVPGISLFYSGLGRRKSALSLLFIPVLAAAVVLLQWFIIGYSLAFSRATNPILGDASNVGFRNVLDQPSLLTPMLPDIMVAIYQSMFAAVTIAIVVGAVAERGRLLPCLVFSFIWTSLVYDFVAYWSWNPSGWLYKLGSLDFAGGTPVHVVSGSAAFAYSYMLGPRKGHGTSELSFRPHNTTLVIIGTTFLWVGWAGFNGGSALAANLRAIVAVVNTNLAAVVAGLAWCIIDFRLQQRFSAIGFCSGVVAGLVAITPGSGFVAPWAAVVYGVVAGVACNFATKIKFLVGVDDALDIFALHGVGGLVGDFMTGIFAEGYIAALDGWTVIPGGWVDKNWIQVAYQLSGAVSGLVYSFVMTCLILFVLKYIPGMGLRMSDGEQVLGADEIEIGEFGYDYVELERDVAASLDAATGLRNMSHMNDNESYRNSFDHGGMGTYEVVISGNKVD